MAAVMHGVLLAATATGHASLVDWGTFVVAAAIVLSGAIGVVVARNPVHSALMLVMTLFGIAVLFVLQRDDFLAAVQVIVYAGAIVVLFLFVIMFLGVDREENIAAEPLSPQRLGGDVLLAVDTEEHDHKEEQDDDGSGVDDDLYRGQEVITLQHEEHGDAEQGHHQHQGRVHRVAGHHHPDGPRQYDGGGDEKSSPVDERSVTGGRSGSGGGQEHPMHHDGHQPPPSSWTG